MTKRQILIRRIGWSAVYIFMCGALIALSHLIGERVAEAANWFCAWLGYPVIILGIWGQEPVRSFWKEEE